MSLVRKDAGTGPRPRSHSRNSVSEDPSSNATKRSSSLSNGIEPLAGQQRSEQSLKRPRTSRPLSPTASKRRREQGFQSGAAHYFTGSQAMISPISPPQRRSNGPLKANDRTFDGIPMSAGGPHGPQLASPLELPKCDKKATHDWPTGRSPPTCPKSMRSAGTGSVNSSLGHLTTYTEAPCSTPGPSTIGFPKGGSKSHDSIGTSVTNTQSSQRLTSIVGGDNTGQLDRSEVERTTSTNVATTACSTPSVRTPHQSPKLPAVNGKSVDSDESTSSVLATSAVSSMTATSKIKKCHTCQEPRKVDEHPRWVRCSVCRRRNHVSCCKPPVAENNTVK